MTDTEIKTQSQTKNYIVHSGWLGKSEIEVEIIEIENERAIVKATQGFPFDMWHESREIPCGAKCVFHNDTYWYDAKIVSVHKITNQSINDEAQSE